MNILKTTSIFLLLNTMLFAQSLSGVKVCIDPGHGGHNSSNDRHVVIPDFWESEGNYSKAIHLNEILTSLGATVIVTRHGNSDSDDLGLSVRAGIANANNVDLFHSIHSNGYHGDANYSLVLFRGTDGSPIYPTAKAYAKIVYDELEKTNHVVDRSNNARGITSFYGSDYLGVIRPLTMPGILSEGSFHDYIPEGWRLKNEQYLRHEAWAITRSMLKHFNAGTLSNGNLAGILRDPFATVPSSYKAISSLGDSKKALNHVKATLQPGGFVYNGDDQNNGYYFFDNIAPGNYKLYLEAEDYALDSANVTIYANKSTFLNKNLSLVGNENNPNITESIPANSTTGYSNAGNIEIQFDIRMDEAITASAFSITPSVAGSISWEDNQKRLVFNPTKNLTPGENYQVKITSSAKTIFGKNLLADYNIQFTTRSKLSLLTGYPLDGASNISRSVNIRLQFDEAINTGTLGGNISFKDSDGKFVNLVVDFYAYSKGLISFVPASDLDLGKSYIITVGENIGDVEGVTFQENLEITFTVETDEFPNGTIVDDFETTGNWKTPQSSGSIGLSESSIFETVNSEKHQGSFSGKLKYTFTESGGVYKIMRVNPVLVGSNAESMFGLWIKGELSNNIIEYWFRDSGNTLHSFEVDTLNFTGWKMQLVKLGDVATGDLRFEGVGIKHIASADTSGTIYIDDAQYDFTTPVINEVDNLPSKYLLSQNYPNPFNPTTTIKYSIPVGTHRGELPQHVVIKVYDILGREVAILVNKNQKAGNYEAVFNALNLTSGIYFYRLTAGDFSKTMKLILIK